MIEDRNELPKGWRWVKLGEVCEIVSGTTPKSGTSAYWNGEIVWITPADLGRLCDRYVVDSDRRISKAGFTSCNLTMAPIGSVVLSSRAPIGHLGIAAVPLCTNQGCKTFVPGTEVDSEFLYRALKRSVWELQQMGSGTTFAEVSKTQLGEFEIPLPPLPEQKRIAAILNEQVAAVERARKAAEERLAAVNRLPAAYLRAVFPAPDQPVPEGWRWVELGEAGKTVTGGTPPRGRKEYFGGHIPWIKPEHLDCQQVVQISTEYLTEAGSDLVGLLPAGSVLVSCIGKIGKTAIAGVPLTTNQQINAIIPRDDVDSVFLYHCFRHYRPALEAMASTALVPILNKSGFSSFEVPCPPLPEQKRIGAILNDQMSAVERARKAAEEELAMINALPAALLRRAFAPACAEAASAGRGEL